MGVPDRAESFHEESNDPLVDFQIDWQLGVLDLNIIVDAVTTIPKPANFPLIEVLCQLFDIVVLQIHDQDPKFYR